MSLTLFLLDRFSLDEKTRCWNWKGSKDKDGYGKLYFHGRYYRAHRVAAHLWLGFPLHSELWVLHRCDNPSCINPRHLFIGTQFDNARDCANKGRMWRQNNLATHCPHGHEYTPENTYTYYKPHLMRCCKTCAKARNRDRQRRHPTAPPPPVPGEGLDLR